MEKIKIDITKCSGKDVYFVTTNRKRLGLCSFERGIGDNTWYFWLPVPAFGRSGFTYVSENGQFPLDALKRLCQAVWFFSISSGEFPEVELTTNSKRLLGIK